MGGVTEFEPGSSVPERNPATKSTYRRQVWLQVYLPFALGLALLAGLGALLWSGQRASASAWADASLILLILPLLVVSVIPIVLLAVLIYGVGFVVGWLPGPAYQAQRTLAEVEAAARKALDYASRPMVVSSSALAAARSGLQHLLSIFRKGSGTAE